MSLASLRVLIFLLAALGAMPALASGTIRFLQASFTAPEGVATPITVLREGGSQGAVSVTVTVTGGSAILGLDVFAQAATLTWQDGEMGARQFVVQPFADSVDEYTEEFGVTLSQPTGAAVLAFPSSAGVVIPANFPRVPSALPPGWATGVTPLTPWTLASDKSYEGGTSLRSDRVFGPGEPGTFGVSEISTPAALYPAGDVTFFYNVSTYPNFGTFEFLVDGVMMLTDTETLEPVSGSEWRFAVVPITAGTHAFTWRFKNALYYPCAVALPAPPRGDGCADRVWVDSVSFPVARTPTSIELINPPATALQSGYLGGRAMVTGAGHSAGRVVFTLDDKLWCSADVIATYAECDAKIMDAGTRTLRAAYTGTDAFQPSVSAPATVVVTPMHAIHFTKTGPGTGYATWTCSPGCGPSPPSVTEGASVTIVANASSGSYFLKWEAGPCAGSTSPLCTFVMSGPVSLTSYYGVLSLTPALTFDPPVSLSMGAVSRGTTSRAYDATIVNSGSGSVAISDISTSDARFTVAYSCPAVLVSGNRCRATLTVTAPGASPPPALNALSTIEGELRVTSDIGLRTLGLVAQAEQSLVTHYYRSILRRDPDGSGKAFWQQESARMQGLGANVNETWYAMAAYFFFSPEYLALGRDAAGFVEDLYRTFFNRGPDAGGLAYWVGQLDAGLPREVVLTSFMFSAEFRSFSAGLFGDPAVRPELDTVGDFYRGLFARLPDGSGFSYWVSQFRVAQCAGAGQVYGQAEAISSMFANGSEYAGRGRSNAQYVGDLYNAFLRRGGDLTGVQYWVSRLDAQLVTRDEVRRQFIATPEFGGRVGSVVAAGCAP